MCIEAVSLCHAQSRVGASQHAVDQGNHENLSGFAFLETAWWSFLPDPGVYIDKDKEAGTYELCPLSSESMATSVDWMWSLICQLCPLRTVIVRNCSFTKAHVFRQTEPDKCYGSFMPALSPWTRGTVLVIILLSLEHQRTWRPLSPSLPWKLYSLILFWGSALSHP